MKESWLSLKNCLVFEPPAACLDCLTVTVTLTFSWHSGHWAETGKLSSGNSPSVKVSARIVDFLQQSPMAGRNLGGWKAFVFHAIATCYGTVSIRSPCDRVSTSVCTLFTTAIQRIPKSKMAVQLKSTNAFGSSESGDSTATGSGVSGSKKGYSKGYKSSKFKGKNAEGLTPEQVHEIRYSGIRLDTTSDVPSLDEDGPVVNQNMPLSDSHFHVIRL